MLVNPPGLAQAIILQGYINALCANSSAIARSSWKTISTTPGTDSTSLEVQGIAGNRLEPLLASSTLSLAMARHGQDPPSPFTSRVSGYVCISRMEGGACMETTVHLLTRKQNWMSGISRDRGTDSSHPKVSLGLPVCLYLDDGLPLATGSSASSVVSGSSVVSVSSGNSGSVTPSSELSVERASQASNGTKLDFSSSIRAEVAKEHKDTVVGLEVRGGGWGTWRV